MPGQAPPLTDERALLLAYIEQQRDGLRFAAYGLTDDQARLTPTAGTLSIGGLVKHVAFTESGWIDRVAGRPELRRPGGVRGQLGTARRRDTCERTRALDEVARETERVVMNTDLDAAVPVPDAPWFPDDVDAWSVRWILLHIVEELARHAGHADIVRESIDGATMFALMAGAEGWPETDYIKPWKPPA